MTPELWERLKPLYSAALDLPEHGRTGYIEQMCDGDPELARELRALIAANQSAANTLDPPLADFSLFRPLRNSVLAPGTVLAGRFRIVRHLGSGGMGDVYEALDLQLEQGHIALKTLRPEIAENPNALARFKAEVLLARKITGPNICRIHELYLTDSNPLSDGGSMPVALLTMELLEGITLHDHIEQHSPLPVAKIRLLADQLCCALTCIHEAGIIHRDLKTRNVMLVPHAGSEKLVVMDFGLALVSAPSGETSADSIQEPHFVAGTPSYMAPEQFEGREAGPPTDIYALGLILYEMATGVQPFAAHTPLAAAIRRSQQPRFASSFRHELPTAWDEIIQRCLEYDPARRFQSANEVAEALKHPDKIVLRLGKAHRIAVPRIALLTAAFVLVMMIAATSWLLITNARRRKLTPEAAHWHELGTTALREGSYLKATKLLTEVTQRDPTYAVAHAALADAWSELDFTGLAQREMLLASSAKEQRGLSDRDRHYIDAVRSTLIHDYPAAASDYEAILPNLPDDRKADGYVDLGRIYEKAGKVNETVAAYEKAAQLNPDDPAPFFHLGILKSRLRQPIVAAQNFDHAEALYRAGSDLEGLAEVAYQRVYAANDAGNFAKAKQFAEQVLGIARQISSVALEVRTLSQLSSVAYHQDQDAQAIDLAAQEAQIARENGLDYWVTDAQIRTGNALMDKEDFTAAEDQLRGALHRAQQDGHPRLEASAQLTLASLCNQKKRWDEQIAFAQSALIYYKDYGFLNPADQAETLVLRGERDKGNYLQALQAGNQLLGIAAQTQSTQSLAMAQELVARLLLALERYPEALTLYQGSVRNTESLGHDAAYPQVGVAEVLWRLGRYAEAQAALASISPAMRKRGDVGSSVATVQAEMLISQGKFQEAINAVRSARSTFPSLSADAPDWNRAELAAEAELKPTVEIQHKAQELVADDLSHHDAGDAALTELVEAAVALKTGDAPHAEATAVEAEHFFADKGLRESQAVALLLQAQAAATENDTRRAASLGKESLDLFRNLEQSWGVGAFHLYLTRPDTQRMMRALTIVCGESGAIPNELSL